MDRIIDGCIRGERLAQKKVYEMFYSKMMGVCKRYTTDDDEAKDVLQESFIKVFEKIGRFSREGSFEGWVRRIVVNTAIDFIRKKKKEGTRVSDVQIADTEPDDFGEEVESKYGNLGVKDVVEAVKQLSPAYRAVFNLYIMENYTHAEIAEDLDISVGSSKSNLAKAKMNLKKILKRRLIKTYE